jgi:hypothetical protein
MKQGKRSELSIETGSMKARPMGSAAKAFRASLQRLPLYWFDGEINRTIRGLSSTSLELPHNLFVFLFFDVPRSAPI